MKLSISLLVFAAALSGMAMADDFPPDAPPPGGHGHHHAGPPPEALAACKGLSVGASAEMKTPDERVLKGSCQLVFVPEHPAGAPKDAPKDAPKNAPPPPGWWN